MNTTIPAGTEVATFAAAVRAALADLPPEELDELTDGLEADLTERAADAGDDLGDPVAYAEELRAAAGYPPRSARSHLGDALPGLRTLPQELRRRWEALLAARPAIAAIVAFFVSLRPVWWVFRGVAVYAGVAGLLNSWHTTFWPVLLGAAVVLSVQVGRGMLQRRRWQRVIQRVVSAIVIVVSPFLVGWGANLINNAMYPAYSGGEVWYPQSLNIGGAQIDNIYAYDAAGEPIEQVQLFDQDGNPLNLTTDTSAQFWGTQSGAMVVPSSEVPGRAGWNVYPLADTDWSSFEDDGVVDESETRQATFPRDHVKPLAGHQEQAPEVAQEMTPEEVPAG